MRKVIEFQQENIDILIMLVKKHPELKVIPIVNKEVVPNDNYNFWTGNWGKAEIDYCYCKDERIYFKSADFEELVDEYMGKHNESHLTNEEDIERWSKKEVNNLKWKKVIVVHIEKL